MRQVQYFTLGFSIVLLLNSFSVVAKSYNEIEQDNLRISEPYGLEEFELNNSGDEKKSLVFKPNMRALNNLFSKRKEKPSEAIVNSWLNNQSLVFEENKGQVTDGAGNKRADVLFSAYGKGMNVFLTKRGITYVLQKEVQRVKNQKEKPSKGIETYRMDMELLGADFTGEIVKEKAIVTHNNYYQAHFPEGILEVMSYEKLTYKEVYPKIDWVIYGGKEALESKGNKGFKYEFIVHPGGDPGQIKMEYLGAESVEMEGKELLIKTPLGDIKEGVPYTYQKGTINSRTISSSYQVNKKEISFQISNYNESKPLVIDPAIYWSTYYGGNGGDAAKGITVDSFGNIFVAGVTSHGGTNNFPTYNPGGGAYYQGSQSGTWNLVVLKFSNTGVRLWATYYGPTNLNPGDSYDVSVAINSNDEIFVAGLGATGFPVQTLAGAYNQASGTSFIIKFSNSGVRQWATCFSSAYTWITSIKVDNNDNLYAAGLTYGIPIQNLPGAYNDRTHGGNWDMFIAKFNSAGALVWSTYYGDSRAEREPFIDIDSNNNLYMAGYVDQAPTPPWQIFKFNSSGALQWLNTYTGNGSNNRLYAIEVDNSDDIFVAGYTNSTDFVTVDIGGGAYYQNTLGGAEDLFIIKYNPAGTVLWATYYGGPNNEILWEANVDGNNNITFVGRVFGAGMPTQTRTGSYNQTSYGGGADSFVIEFTSQGVRQWATYLGGTASDRAHNVANDTGNNTFVIGRSDNTGFPIQDPGGGAYYQTSVISSECFITKFGSSPLLPTELTRFTANWNNKAQTEAVVEWQTETETNNEYFYIERSTDAIHFEDIARVDGALNSTSTIDYSYIDDGLFDEKSIFYRLRQVDIDGTTTYSNIEVLNKEEGIDIIVLYPNPNFGSFKYLVSSSVDSEIDIEILDHLGRVVKKEKTEIEKGINNLSADVSDLRSANYIIHVQTADGLYKTSSRFMLKKQQ